MEREEGGLLAQPVREMLDGAKLPGLQTLFADELEVSRNPVGSLTIPSAVIVMGTKRLTWDEQVMQKSLIVRRTGRKKVALEGQMGFGI